MFGIFFILFEAESRNGCNSLSIRVYRRAIGSRYKNFYLDNKNNISKRQHIFRNGGIFLVRE